MPIIELADLNVGGIEPYFGLTERGLRRDGIFVAESPNVIERALDAGVSPLSFLCERKHIGGDARRLLERYPEVPVFTGQRELLREITGYELTRGVLCAMKRPKPIESEALIKEAKRLCVVYEVCDSTNIGTIFRTATALGFDAVILSKGSCDPLTRRTIRVSMGAVFQIKWAFSEDIVTELKRASFEMVSTALKSESISLSDFRVEKGGRYAVIFGGEGYGLPDEVIAKCDFTVTIPMHGGVDSLNVGAAAAITLWHFRPQ